jgi:MraZ protein
MVDLLAGEYNATLDEKGRLSLPARLRTLLAVGRLMITQGAEGCVWLYTPEKWEELLSRLRSLSIYTPDDRAILRNLVGPVMEVEIDRAGRIQIPQSLRDHAALVRDCKVMGVLECVEIWDAGRYRDYVAESQRVFNRGFAGLDPRGKEKKKKKKDTKEKEG